MMYTCSNETSRSHLRKTRRHKRRKMLSYTSGLRARRDICLSTGANSICEGLDQTGFDSMASSTSNTNLHLLGRSAEPIRLLQGPPSNIVVGSGVRLFVPASNSGVGADTRILDMVVKTPILVPLTKRLSGLKAIQVIHYLEYSFNAARHLIIIDGFHTMPQNLLEELPGIEHMYGNEVGPVNFYGGPPNRPGWYRGSLLTFLTDKILAAYARGDTGLLERFLNVQL